LGDWGSNISMSGLPLRLLGDGDGHDAMGLACKKKQVNKCTNSIRILECLPGFYFCQTSYKCR
jgi:hypothetical protein